MSEAVSDLEERLREMASHDALIRTDVNIFREAADTLATLRAEGNYPLGGSMQDKLSDHEPPDLPNFEARFAEALDALKGLLAFSRVGTFDEAAGEREAEARAEAVLDHYARAV